MAYLQRARDIYKRHGMDDSSEDMLRIDWSVSILLVAQRRYAEALTIYNRILCILRKRLSPDHPKIATLLRAIGRVRRATGDTSLAAEADSAATAIEHRSQSLCAGPGCTRRLREDGTPLPVCTGCNRTHYCSVACQAADWRREGGHKGECAALADEGRGVAAGPPPEAGGDRPLPPRCGGPGSGREGKAPHGGPLDVCNGCKRAHYCGAACQAADWKAGHKAACGKGAGR